MKRTIRRNAIVTLFLLAWLEAANAATPPMPTFLARRDYTGLLSNWVQVGDTNGDGIPDIIASFEGNIEVLLGNGDGTFSPGPGSTTAVSGGSVSFVAADLNGDGNVDLVLQGAGGFAVCLGNGDGTFQFGTVYLPGNDVGAGFMVIGDFNGDGIPDIAMPARMGVWLFTGKGDGTFNPGVLAAPLAGQTGNGGTIAAADFNGDHNLDLVVTIPSGGPHYQGQGFAVLLGNGNGTFQAPKMFAPPGDAFAVAAGKLPNGHPGVALSVSDSSDVYLYYGNGTGSFSGPHITNLPVGSGWGGIAIGDVNGDGIPDLVSDAGYIAFGTTSGTFKSPVYYPVLDEENSNLVLVDLRNNGLTDIVTDNYYGVSVLLSEGKGRYEDGEWTAVTGGGGCGAPADYNGDGKPDLAVATSTGVSILLGTGKIPAPFRTGTPITLTGAGCVVTGDLNNDGIPDLLVSVNGSPNALVSYLGNGDGTFTLKSTTPTPSSGGYVVLADFNHDGKLDFATSGNLMALGNGDGTFQTPVPIVSNPPSTGFSNIAVGDINNDGWPDLVLPDGNVQEGDGCLLLNNRHGGFNQLPWTFGPLQIQAILADLNGDGYLDLVLQNTSGGTGVFLGNGTGSFTLQTNLGSFGGFAGIDMVADLNGDGIPDIALQFGDTLQIYLGQGSATYATPFNIGTSTAPGALIVENLHGQPDFSGLPDIVVPDFSGGVMVLINATK
jgi:hypothetical protein